MNKPYQTSSKILSVIFIMGLLVILFIYLLLVSNLGTQVYTETQQEYLRYNDSRVVSQASVQLNLYQFDKQLPGFDAFSSSNIDMVGVQVPTNFTVWENQMQAVLQARYEEQTGVSVTVYDLDFESHYHFQHAPTSITTTLELLFPFPGNLETLNGVQLLVDGTEPENVQYTTAHIRWLTTLAPGDEHDVVVKYQANGVNQFVYRLNQDRRTDNLDVQVTVDGLMGSNVPRYSLPETRVTHPTDHSENYIWQYENLVANRDIQLELPQQLSFAQRVAALQDDFVTLAVMAPFLIGLFLAVLAAVLYVQQISLGLPGYLLMGFGFFLFYPLLTFLSGIAGLGLAAPAALAVVMVLLMSFLHRATRQRQLQGWLIWLLLVFLGIFSLGMLTPWRGLALTMGGLMLSGTLMLLYAKRPFPVTSIPERKPALEPITDTPPSANTDAATNVEVNANAPITANAEADLIETELTTSSAATPGFHAHCPHCGRGLYDDYSFCPGCGYDGQQIYHCPHCEHEQAVPDLSQSSFCVHCGRNLASK